jgi:toxin YoeB
VIFTLNAWRDYTSHTDGRLLQRIHTLIEDIRRNGHRGIGKPEALRGDLAGHWSRRIDHEHRLVYRIKGEDIVIIACKSHYGDR